MELDLGTIQSNHAAAVAEAAAAVKQVHLSLSDDDSEDGVEDEPVSDGVEDLPEASRQASVGSVVSVEAVLVEPIPAVTRQDSEATVVG